MLHLVTLMDIKNNRSVKERIIDTIRSTKPSSAQENSRFIHRVTLMAIRDSRKYE